MPLAAGDKLGPYQITGLLGKGGMGEVYRARDPRLERDVAIKVLPAALAHNRERLARFEREAKVLAALNHPNIATIYGLEEMPGNARAIVMELVEGPTLSERLKAGRLSQDEAVGIAQQIIAALEAAHEKGVVHRDLKPANVKAPIDGDAPVKVLDFGLATAVQATASEPGDGRGESPTLTMGATEAGVILGTAGYMSPEQAAGKNADKRADIWSFGVVLWEMLAGERLFAGGESVSHILADVLRAPIDFERIPAGSLRELLRRCLDRDVKTRLRDIGEARVALARAGSGVENPAQVGNLPHKGSRLWPAVAAALAVATGVALWAPWRAEPERPLVRLEVDLGADVALLPNPGSDVVLSPDGTRIAYVTLDPTAPEGAPGKGPGVRGGRGGNRSRLFVRRLDQAKAVELPTTAGGSNLFFSPDSQWIGFFAGLKLFKISVEGGTPVPLVDVQTNTAADWGEDGTIVMGGSGLWRIPPDGQPVKLTEPDNSESRHLFPRILPGGKAALFVVANGTGRNVSVTAIEAVDLANGARKVIVPAGSSPHYLPSGHLVYMSDGKLFAIGFDPDRLETRGTPVPVLDDVKFVTGNGITSISFSSNGTLVYRRGEGTGGFNPTGPRATIEWIDPSGKRSPLLSEPQRFSRLRISPDRNQLAVLITDPDSRDYWVYDLRRGTRNKITFGGLSVSTAAWAPDGRSIFFGNGTPNSGIYWTTADGAGQPQRLLDTKGGGVWFVTSYSASAKRLAYFAIQGRIFTLPVTEENGQWKAGTREPFFESQFSEQGPAFSPDGRWLAYSTDESGRPEVNVRAFPPPASGQSGQARKWTVSTNGGTAPHWSTDGRELLYLEGDRIMAVSYTVSGDTFVPGKPRVRVEKLGTNLENWDLASDGRIVVVKPIETPEAPSAPPAEHTVVFLENFFDELRRRVPVR